MDRRVDVSTTSASGATFSAGSPARMPGRDPRWPWVVVWVSAALMLVVDLAVVWEWVSDQPYHYQYWLESTVAGVAFALVGALITSRVPGNIIGPLMLAVLPLGVLQGASGVLAYVGLRNDWPPMIIAVFGAAFNAAQTATVFVVGFVLLLVPDGRPFNRFWKLVAVAVAALGIASVLSSFLLGPNPVATAESAGDPLPGFPVGLSLVPESVRQLVMQGNSAALASALVALALVVVQLVHRLIASSPEDRRRTGWAVAGAIAAPAGIALLDWINFPTVYGGSPLWAVSLSLFPFGVLLAVTRGGLYGLDRVVSRTVSYAIVSGLVLTTYAVIVTAASSLLGDSSTLAVAGATLAAAALVRPALTRVQRSVDRRFDREKVDAQREVDAFAARLSDAVDPEATSAELLAVTRRTLAPASLALWMVDR